MGGRDDSPFRRQCRPLYSRHEHVVSNATAQPRRTERAPPRAELLCRRFAACRVPLGDSQTVPPCVPLSPLLFSLVSSRRPSRARKGWPRVTPVRVIDHGQTWARRVISTPWREKSKIMEARGNLSVDLQFSSICYTITCRYRRYLR